MSLFREYDAFVNEISWFHENEKKITRYAKGLRNIKLQYKDLMDAGNNPTLRRSPEILAHYSAAIPQFYREGIYLKFSKIILSEYPREELCNYLIQKFPNIDFEQLKKLHKTFEYKNPLWNFGKSIGGIFGIGLTLLNIVPETVITEMGFNFNRFEVNVFWSTVILSMILGVLLFPISSAHRKIVDNREFTKYLLDRIVIIQNKNHS